MKKTLKEELLEYQDKYLRAVAELENYKKRTRREYEELLKYANERLICALIGLMDDFERGLAGLKEVKDKKPEIDSGDEFYNGVALIYNKLISVLEQEGVESFSGVGKMFDPKFHEAVEVRNSDDKPQNYIVDEVAKGYKLKDKVIRPAKVVVNKKEE